MTSTTSVRVLGLGLVALLLGGLARDARGGRENTPPGWGVRTHRDRCPMPQDTASVRWLGIDPGERQRRTSTRFRVHGPCPARWLWRPTAWTCGFPASARGLKRAESCQVASRSWNVTASPLPCVQIACRIRDIENSPVKSGAGHRGRRRHPPGVFRDGSPRVPDRQHAVARRATASRVRQANHALPSRPADYRGTHGRRASAASPGDPGRQLALLHAGGATRTWASPSSPECAGKQEPPSAWS